MDPVDNMIKQQSNDIVQLKIKKINNINILISLIYLRAKLLRSVLTFNRVHEEILVT